MNPEPLELAHNPLLAAADAALHRARKGAEDIAAATNTAIIQVVDGQLVRFYPKASERSEACR